MHEPTHIVLTGCTSRHSCQLKISRFPFPPYSDNNCLLFRLQKHEMNKRNSTSVRSTMPCTVPSISFDIQTKTNWETYRPPECSACSPKRWKLGVKCEYYAQLVCSCWRRPLCKLYSRECGDIESVRWNFTSNARHCQMLRNLGDVGKLNDFCIQDKMLLHVLLL